MANFDTIVIGGGPGGYVAAIRAAQLGQNVAVIDSDKAGGRCLNYACIPAKTVLHTAEVYDEVNRHGADLGIKSTGLGVEWPKVQARREEVSKTLEGGVEMLWKKNKVEFIHGAAKLVGDGKVEVAGEIHEAKSIILATGSVPVALPGIEFSDRVVDTWGAWSADKQPKSIVVAGAGASGAEIASAYSRMGTKVTLVEMLDRVLPTEEPEMSRVVERQFTEDGVDLRMGSKVEGVTEQKTAVKVAIGDDEVKADFLAVAGGRRADVDELGLDAVGLALDETGKIPVDGTMKTSVEGIYAIGDLVAGPALAHKASEEGVVAAEAIAGMDVHAVEPDLIPRATFCHPQVASVGLTEEQAKAEGHEVKVGKFKIGGTGASVVYDDRAGMVKIVGEAEFGEILGAHIVGNSACDMISEVVNTMALEGGYPELARIIHPHPTVSEAVLDAARAVEGWATHA